MRLITRSTREDRRLVRVVIVSLVYLGGYAVLRLMQ